MSGLRKSDLLAITGEPGPAWIGVIRDAWAAGAAVFPLDHRLSKEEAGALLARARPAAVWDGESVTRRGGGMPAGPGAALVAASSGTAGPPKLAELTHAAVRAALDGSNARLDDAGAGSDPRQAPWLCCLPPAHVGGLLVLLRAAVLGTPVEVHPRFDPHAVARADAAFVSLVPTMLARLLDAQATPRRLRTALIGGAAMPPALAARAREAGIEAVATYGLTETCGGVVYDGAPFPGTDLRIGEDAQILVRGPTVFTTYRGDPEATRSAWTEDGWLRTKDAGELADGVLRVLGRLDEAVVTGGEKVWPEEVEAVLRDHPAVADVAVAGRPDPEWGARVVAFVVPAAAGSPPSLEDLRARAKERLAAYKIPKDLVLLPRLPRTPSGKLRRRALPEATNRERADFRAGEETDR